MKVVRLLVKHADEVSQADLRQSVTMMGWDKSHRALAVLYFSPNSQTIFFPSNRDLFLVIKSALKTGAGETARGQQEHLLLLQKTGVWVLAPIWGSSQCL